MSDKQEDIVRGVEVQSKIDELFDTFLQQQTIYKEKDALKCTYIPNTIYHRDGEVKQIAQILAPSLRGEIPNNILINGSSGVGKTTVVKYVAKSLKAKAQSMNVPFDYIYLNCKLQKINTQYRLLANIANELGRTVPATGLPTDAIYKIVYELINTRPTTLVVILDEIDAMSESSDGLYCLYRINDELANGSKVCVIGISNDINFIEKIDTRAKSSSSREDVIFPSYNAMQLKSILEQRASIAFQEGVMEPGVIERCAALAAQESGDVRRALDLLRVAGELAERKGFKKVSESQVTEAEERIEADKVAEQVKDQPRQSQAVIWSVIKLSENAPKGLATGDVFDYYSDVCKKINMKPLTQRRVSDLIAELDILGIITAKVISKGRYGRTRKISLAISQQMIPKVSNILEQELMVD